MVAMQDNKSRQNAQKMPLSQHFSQNPLKPVAGGNNHPFIKSGNIVQAN